ncbi:hypothetical protein C8A03DRAFT_37354 [Achaetomium macrosporum]|uniref:Uncharacterized protein n=1 Tax=Achaetomium macrosporum TaxID=79813 RepID=A0AAN7C3Q4_9PEZI|nr:hypothetical protein C8A03DRAFT_37354 [Achaetomium macrosporum]
MTLPQSTDVSSSSLALSGTGSPSLHPLSAHPPREVERYEKRALPPVPPKRESGVSNFSKVVDDALATPDPVDTPEGSIVPFIYRPSLSPRAAPEDGDAEFVEILDYPTDSKQRRGDLKLATADLPATATGSALSPKVAKVLGVRNPRKNTPSGHESPEKVKRLVGFELACAGSKAQMQHRSEQYGQLQGEVSPLSNTSSPYDHDDPRTAVSDLDAEAEADGRVFSPEPSPGYFFSSENPHRHSTGSSPFPGPLRVVKPARSNRSPQGRVTEMPRHGEGPSHFQGDMDLATGYDRPTPSDRPSSDLYHEAAKQLAKEDTLAAQRAKQSTARQFRIQQFMQMGTESSADTYRNSKSKQLPPLPHQYRRRRHQHPEQHPSDARPSGSTERLQPVWRPSNAQQDSPRAVSASTFGRLTHRFHAQQYSASPSSFPDPGPRSVFECDSDSHGAGTIDTPDTGGSIPISLQSSGDCPSPAACSRHSSSIMAKVFHRISASPTTPTPPVPNNTPLEPSFLRSHRLQHNSPSVPAAYSHSHSSFPSSINHNKIKAKTSMSALTSAAAAKTNDLVSAAAEFIIHKSASGISSMSMSMSGGSKESQRRERLKSSIRVLPDGRQVVAPGSFSFPSASASSFPVSAVSPGFDYAGVHAAGRERLPGRPGLGCGQRAAGSNADLGSVMGRESPRPGTGNGSGGEKSARASPVPSRGRGASTPRQGASPRGSLRPRREGSGPSPRPSGERHRN